MTTTGMTSLESFSSFMLAQMSWSKRDPYNSLFSFSGGLCSGAGEEARSSIMEVVRSRISSSGTSINNRVGVTLPPFLVVSSVTFFIAAAPVAHTYTA